MVKLSDVAIYAENEYKVLTIHWTPTFPKCGFASQIGLAIRRKLERALSNASRYKVELLVRQEHHEDA